MNKLPLALFITTMTLAFQTITIALTLNENTMNIDPIKNKPSLKKIESEQTTSIESTAPMQEFVARVENFNAELFKLKTTNLKDWKKKIRNLKQNTKNWEKG